MAILYEGNITFDLGNLAAFDITSIDPSEIFQTNSAEFQETVGEVAWFRKRTERRRRLSGIAKAYYKDPKGAKTSFP